MAASRVACASFNIGTNTTITITRDKSTYTHTLKYNFNGATGTIVTKTTATNYVWMPPANVIYAKIPNTTTGYGTVTCETYEGNELIGTTTAGFYAYTVKSVCSPTVSGSVVDTNPATVELTGDSNALILYLSKPKCTLTASAKNSANIKTIQIENPIGLVATTSPFTFDTVYSKEFRFKATDSRGYSTIVPLNVAKFIEYAPCYFEPVPIVARVESTSTTATTTLTGYCFNGNFGITSNTLELKYRYKTSNGTYGNYVNIETTWNSDGTFAANVNIPNLSTAETYTIEFVVSDKLTSFPVEVVLGQSMGDFRIAKSYVQSRNNFVVGDEMNKSFQPLTVKRNANGKKSSADIGVSDDGGINGMVMQLFMDGVGKARIDLKEDGHLYNFFTNMSMAEIMATAPTMANDGATGYMLLNGGNSAPVLLQWGKLSKVPETANVATSQEVNFIRSFVGIPAVFMTALSMQGGTVETSPEYITENGFTAYLRRINIANTTIHWLAIGNGSNAMPE